MKPKGFGP